MKPACSPAVSYRNRLDPMSRVAGFSEQATDQLHAAGNGLPNKALQQTSLLNVGTLARQGCLTALGFLMRPLLNSGTLGGRECA